MNHKLSLALSALGVAAVATFGMVPAASAEILEEGAAILVESALEANDATLTEPGLLDELVESITEAEELGLLDPAIVEESNALVENPEAPTDALDGLIDEQADEQIENWQAEAPAIKAAFETVRAQFQECRADGQTTVSACAQQLRFQYQFALAEVKLARIDEEIAKVADLPEAEQAERLAALENQRTRVLALLAKAETAAVESGTALTAGETQRLNGLITEFQGRASALQGAGAANGNAAAADAGSNGAGASSGSGNAGGQGNAPSANPGSGNASNGAAASGGNAGGNAGSNGAGSGASSATPGSQGNGGSAASSGRNNAATQGQGQGQGQGRNG